MTQTINRVRRHFWIALVLIPAIACTAIGANWGRTRPQCLTGIPNHHYNTAERSPIKFAVSSQVILMDARPRVTPLPTILAPVPVIPVPELTLPEPPIPETLPRPSPPEPLPPLVIRPAIAIEPAARFQELLPPPLPAKLPLDNNFSKLFQWPTEKIVIEHCEVVRPAVQIHPNGEWTLNLEARQNPGFDPATLKRGFEPTAFILRNKFQLYVRCYDTGRAPDKVAVAEVGHPCVAEIGPIEFMVERGEPLLVRRSGNWTCKCRSDVEAFSRMDRVELQFSFQR